MLAPGDPAGILLPALEHPGAKFGADPVAARNRMLLDSLGAAYRDAVARMEQIGAPGKWGRLHHGYFPPTP